MTFAEAIYSPKAANFPGKAAFNVRAVWKPHTRFGPGTLHHRPSKRFGCLVGGLERPLLSSNNAPAYIEITRVSCNGPISEIKLQSFSAALI